MKLKLKNLNWSAGRPVAILHEKLADNKSINVNDRIIIKKGRKSIVAVVDTAAGLFKKNEIIVSTEVLKTLKAKKKELVEIELALKPESISLIYKKLEGNRLKRKEYEEIMRDIANNSLTETEIAFFVSAVYNNSMDIKETADLTRALVNTGQNLKLKNVVDKHSIGGIPGRLTPIIIPICASAGLIMPKTSSRAITTPAGTADAIECLARVDFSIPEVEKITRQTGACMVWGGSLNLAPADDKIIRVERVLNLDPEAQLLASIMAKKISVNAKHVLIDIPYGENAKVNKSQAKSLAKKFKKLGKIFKIKIKCILTKVNEPLGNGIGPSLEIKDVLKVLRREDSCHLLEKNALIISGKILELTKKARRGTGIKLAREILESGKAFKKFIEIIKAQKGKLKKIQLAKFSKTIRASRNGRIKEINIKKINQLAKILGCPVDKAAGIYLYKHLNDKIKKGDSLLTLYSESKEELSHGLNFYKKLKPIDLG